MTTDPVHQIFARFRKNLTRTTRLVDSFYEDPGKVGRPLTHRADLLRAAVVLLHATLEDLLRSLEIELVDRYIHSAMRLDKVKFAIPGEGKSRETIRLDVLVSAYGAAGVVDVLADAIAAHKLQELRTLKKQKSYSGVKQIKSALARLQVPEGTDPESPFGVSKDGWSDIAAMIARRHLIAHSADRHEKVGQGYHMANPISKAGFLVWVNIVKTLGNSIQKQL